jgi:hypothetical protein
MSNERKREINDFIINNMGTPFHEVYYNCIAAECFNTEAIYMIAYKDSDIVGVCPVHFIKKGILKIGYSNLDHYETPYGGWIYKKSHTTIRELVDSMKIGWKEVLRYRSSIILNNESNNYKGFVPRQTVIVDMDVDIDTHFNNLDRKTRNKIRRATKLGIKIRYLSIRELADFLELTRELKGRIGQRYNEELYRKVFHKYSEEDRIQCIVTEYNQEIISGGILIANKNFAIGWIPGRKTDIPNNLYQNELLYWQHIVWCKKKNIKYLDYNGLSREKYPQLARLKLSFSKDIKMYYGTSYKSISSRLILKFQKILKN